MKAKLVKNSFANRDSLEVTQEHKLDEGKTEYRLLPPKALRKVAEVLTFGAKKYSPHSWRFVESFRLLDAAYRHLETIRTGELVDTESGLPHLAHAITNLMFILESQLEGLVNSDKDLGTR